MLWKQAEKHVLNDPRDELKSCIDQYRNAENRQ